MTGTDNQHRSILQRIAHRVMLERGLLPDFSAEALAELATIQAPSATDDEKVRDLRDLLWASIDNDDSLDLDQLTVAEAMPGNAVKIRVAVADVDCSLLGTAQPLMIMPATTRPPCILLPQYFPCFLTSCLQTLLL